METKTLQKIADNNWELTQSHPTIEILTVDPEKAIRNQDSDLEDFDSFYSDTDYVDGNDSSDTWRLYDLTHNKTLCESSSLNDIENYVTKH